MNAEITYIIEATASAILLYWVLTHSAAFAYVTSASSTAVVGSFQALIGR